MSRRSRRRRQGVHRPLASTSAAGRASALWGMALTLALLAGAVSLYLTYAHYKVRERSGWQSFCGVSSWLSCDAVSASDFSAVAGIPVAWAGSVFYAALTWVAWRALRGRRSAIPRSPALALVAGGTVASAISVLLAVVSVRSIGAICPLCLALYGFNGALLLLGVLAMGRGLESLGQATRAEYANLRRHVGTATFSVVAGVALLGALPLTLSQRPAPSKAESNPPFTNLCEYIEAKRASGVGSDTKLVVYTDYQCPFCRRADAALGALREVAGVTVTTRHYPLDRTCNSKLPRTVHDGACRQAAAVICAQGLGDELGRLIFESGAKDPASLARLAEGLGMEAVGFEACLESPATGRRLAADIAAALRDDVRGTPTILVDGQRYRGSLDPAAFDCLAQPSPAPGSP